MPVVISLIRGINVGGNRQIKMDALRAIYESAGVSKPQTYIQSGNVVFSTKEKNLAKLATKLEDAIEAAVGFRPSVVNRTLADLRAVISTNPFASRDGTEGSKLLIVFLADDPGDEAREKIRALKTDPEEIVIAGREMYIYYPNGMGRSKLAPGIFEKALKTPGTGRNLNTVSKLVEIGSSLDV